MKEKLDIQSFTFSILNSYSQVFFSENKLFAIILLIVSFFDIQAGFSGLLCVTTVTITAWLLGFNRFNIRRGIYGFNALLIGLGIGLIFEPGIALYVILMFSSIFSLFITIALQGILLKYGLPFLSIPFLIGIWIVLLASGGFSDLGLSERGIFTANALYQTGGKSLLSVYEYLNTSIQPESIKIYFLSLGAIFFQNNVPAGILIALGLLFYSRISFSLSIIGFYSAFLFYDLTGADFNSLAYTYIGFNYMLTSIAIGAYFLLPDWRSYLWSILILPIVVIITTGFGIIFNAWSLSVYSLPFNITVLLFIYVLKLRFFNRNTLNDSFIKQSNPEKTVYLNKSAIEENKKKLYFPIHLPVWGKWTIMQGPNGEYTHQGEWRHAWDFVITDGDNKQFKNDGDKLEDYFCFSKPVTAPADGLVVNCYDGVDDNKPGDINTLKNWGNSVVIQHSEYLFTQISHLKRATIKVKKGDYVKKGDLIAMVGNSGHSPYPHLHFQIQSTPHIGSKTMDYPLSDYILTENEAERLMLFGYPEKNQIISAGETDEILDDVLNFIPGKIMHITFQKAETVTESLWEIEKTIYNESYIVCRQSKAKAFFWSDENSFYFQNYYGTKKTALFHFFKSLYSVKKIYCANSILETQIRPDLFFNKGLLVLQDFIAPFFLFLKVKHKFIFRPKKDLLSHESLIADSSTEMFVLKRKKKTESYSVAFYRKGEIQIISSSAKEISKLTINTNVK